VSRRGELTAIHGVFVTAVLLSVVHYADNTVRFDDYTGGQDSFITQPMIPISWVLFTVAGVAGLGYLRAGNRGLAGSLLGVYSVSGLIGLFHYTTVAPGDFTGFQNTFIVLDFLAGLAVLLLAVGIAIGRWGSAAEADIAPSP